jgi:hypothetical protein
MTTPQTTPNPSGPSEALPDGPMSALHATPAEQAAQDASEKIAAEMTASQLRTPFGAIVHDLQAENAVGLLLVAQLGSSPSEMLLVVRTVIHDPAVGGLRPLNQYVIKLVGLVEHKISLGLFNHLALVEDHPLLHHHNAPNVRIYLSSAAADPDTVLGEIEDTHFEMFGRWRELGDDLNHRIAPHELLKAGMGTLGEFPAPFADALCEVLKTHDISYTATPGEQKIGRCYLLAFDNSYLIARGFTVEQSPA